MVAPRSIVLHIGFPKTGTTSLQMGLAGSRALLAENGCYFPSSLGPDNQFHLQAYAYEFDRKIPTHTTLGIRSQKELEQFRQRCRQTLMAEIEGLPADIHTVILSNEGMSGLTLPSEFDRMFELFEAVGRLSKVVAYIRRQDLTATSQYTTYLKHGGTRRAVLQQYREDARAFIFFGKKLKLWADRVGPQSVVVRHFAPAEFVNGDLFADFAFAAGLPPGIQISLPRNANPSISAAACVFLQYFNRDFPRFVDGRPNPMRATVRDTIEAEFPGSGLRPTRSEVMTYMRQFEESNEYVRQTWFADRKTLFDDDYSQYPEHRERPTLEDVSAVFNAVWRRRHEVLDAAKRGKTRKP